MALVVMGAVSAAFLVVMGIIVLALIAFGESWGCRFADSRIRYGRQYSIALGPHMHAFLLL